MMKRVFPSVLGALLALVMAGCEHLNLNTGASGTKVEAKAVVRVIYDQQSDAAVGSLPYRGVDIPRAVKRIRDRFSQIKPFLERGAIGIGSDGLLRMRDAAGLAQEERAALERLIRAENSDRLLVYRGLADQTGHGDESDWIAYIGETFAAEWIGQAPAGWWYQDDRRRWAQKPATSGTK